jgi:hypothetical protein
MSSDPRSDALLIEVVDDADLASADREIIRRWLHEEWPPETDPYKWSPLHWFVLARHDGELVGMVTVLERTIAVAGQPIHIAGIGNVITATPWRAHRDRLRSARGLLVDELGVLLRAAMRVAPDLL